MMGAISKTVTSVLAIATAMVLVPAPAYAGGDRSDADTEFTSARDAPLIGGQIMDALLLRRGGMCRQRLQTLRNAEEDLAFFRRYHQLHPDGEVTQQQIDDAQRRLDQEKRQACTDSKEDAERNTAIRALPPLTGTVQPMPTKVPNTASYQKRYEEMFFALTALFKDESKCDIETARRWLQSFHNLLDEMRVRRNRALKLGKYSSVDPLEANRGYFTMRSIVQAMEASFLRYRLHCARKKAEEEGKCSLGANSPGICTEGPEPPCTEGAGSTCEPYYGSGCTEGSGDTCIPVPPGGCTEGGGCQWTLPEGLGTGCGGTSEPKCSGGASTTPPATEPKPEPKPSTKSPEHVSSSSSGVMRGYVTVDGGIDSWGVPVTGIGFQRDGAYGTAPETFGVTTGHRVTAPGGGAVFTFGRFKLYFNYGQGKNDSGLTTIPPDDGIDSGIVYGTLSPDGSSGIATPFGSSGSIHLKAEHWSLGAIYRVFGRPDGGASASAYASYGGYRTKIDGNMSGNFTVYDYDYQFSQTRNQKLSDNMFEVGVKGQYSWNSGPVRPFVHGSAGIYYLHGSLDSMEHNTNNFSSEGDRDWTFSRQESRNKVGFHGRIDAGVSVPVTPGVDLFVRGTAEYRSQVSGVFNPFSGDQVYYDGLSTHITGGHQWNYGGRIGVRVTSAALDKDW